MGELYDEQPPWLAKHDYRPQEQFSKPIGEMIWAFGWLDEQLDLVLISLFRIDTIDLAQALLSQLGQFEAKIDLFSQSANLRFSDGSKSDLIKQLHDDLDEVNGMRNHIVHGRGSSFVWPPLRMAIARVRSRSETFGRKNYFYAPEEISEVSNKMIRIGVDLAKLKWEINALFEKGPPKEQT